MTDRAAYPFLLPSTNRGAGKVRALPASGFAPVDNRFRNRPIQLTPGVTNEDGDLESPGGSRRGSFAREAGAGHGRNQRSRASDGCAHAYVLLEAFADRLLDLPEVQELLSLSPLRVGVLILDQVQRDRAAFDSGPALEPVAGAGLP